jgi:Asp/Glu/hydantoin racemase
VRRPDSHPKVLETAELHAVPVVGDFDSIIAEGNHDLRAVSVVTVLDQLRECYVGFAYQAFP